MTTRNQGENTEDNQRTPKNQSKEDSERNQNNHMAVSSPLFAVSEVDLKSSSLQICHKENEKSQTRRKGFTTKDFNIEDMRNSHNSVIREQITK